MKTKMKKLNIVLIELLFALAMAVFLISAETAKADDSGNYVVRIFQGNRGKLQSDPVVFTVKKGQRIGENFTPDMVPAITDNRYCFVGLRLLGTDEVIPTALIGDIIVKADMDFVCAYGITSDIVPYEVSYEDASTGRTLGTVEGFGKLGSTICLSARYFEGYVPRNSSISFTLREREKNSICFVYDQRSGVDPEIVPKTETIPKPVKIKNPLTLTVAKKTFRQSALKKAKSFKIGAKKAQGKVTYTLNKKAKKAKIKVTEKGKVTIPKKCKPGTYKITVKAAGKGVYKAGKKTVTIVIKNN